MEEAPEKKRSRFAPIAARVDMINGNFELPTVSVTLMREIRECVAAAAKQIEEIFETAPEYDMGRAIHTIDLLQQAKNTACDALILPYHPAASEEN